MRALISGVALFALACESPAPVCEGSVWGVAAYDALYAVGGPDPLVHEDPARWIDGPSGARLSSRLDAASRVRPPARLSEDARVVLQNDVWGLWQRVDALETSSLRRAAIRASAARLTAQLATRPRGRSRIESILGEGFDEVASEHPSLGHERLFGLRRHFRLRERGETRALYSTLVALDPDGRPRPTSVLGDLEILRFEGDRLVGARLYELDRRRVRCGRPGLVEVREARRVPGVGADRPLAVFDPPAPLDALPCARCHEDASAMSLPTRDLDPGWRFDALLEQARRPE